MDNKFYKSSDLLVNYNAIIDKLGNILVVGCKTTVIPTSVTTIGSYAFSGCTGLTSITISSNVTSIGSYAFSGCTGLTSITIPTSVTTMGEAVFSGCLNINTITCNAMEKPTGWHDNWLGLTGIIVKWGISGDIIKSTGGS